MRAKHLRRSIKRQWFTGALCLIIVILLILSAILGIQLIREMRRNQFSKNIILSNNYFLGAEETGNNSYWLDDIMVQCMESTEYANKEDFPLDFLVEIRKKLGALDEVDAQEKFKRDFPQLPNATGAASRLSWMCRTYARMKRFQTDVRRSAQQCCCNTADFPLLPKILWISIWNASR